MSSTYLDPLFRPFALKSLALKNRIVMAPMTRSFAPAGVPNDRNTAYYRRRAESEVGLILSEGTGVDRPGSRNDPNVPLFHGEEALAGWKQVIDGVHEAGGKMGPQLWHVGSSVSPQTDWKPERGIESPSGLAAPRALRGEAMTDEAIADTISAFARAAADSKRLGFDTVEIHAAHGYLLDQFFWEGTNQRIDHFNGTSTTERSRFVVEIVKAIRKAVGPDFPVILRLSQWKPQDYSARLVTAPKAMSDWLVPLVEAGADILHCSQRRFWEAEFPELDGEQGLNFAGWAKKLTGAATISVGSVGLSGDFIGATRGESSKPASLENLVQRLERDEFDLIAVGRALLSDPQWVTKIRSGSTDGLKPFTPADLAELV
ncbi:Putative oxidoreductase [Pseudomonas mandelii JR-1]|uniref:Putative oxidoreductase n=1 Tax=Pseudomonas mandelii JR-1 TaxID=1147786 RepID=A0A024EGJ7_9PSED|nr:MULTISPECIES: NADH:flavin oxidoreductase [Pseudomonas]AHZ71690.1 Putative oxidoreductase [Pseudomonas mandelii JR-1]MDR8385935.1 NADH:flavin oxidoreductase [Pseudomonas sp. JL2]OYQ08355.1 12-oxophytodienoate reductase [Pseudomonas mandelii]